MTRARGVERAPWGGGGCAVERRKAGRRGAEPTGAREGYSETIHVVIDGARRRTSLRARDPLGTASTVQATRGAASRTTRAAARRRPTAAGRRNRGRRIPGRAADRKAADRKHRRAADRSSVPSRARRRRAIRKSVRSRLRHRPRATRKPLWPSRSRPPRPCPSDAARKRSDRESRRLPSSQRPSRSSSRRARVRKPSPRRKSSPRRQDRRASRRRAAPRVARSADASDGGTRIRNCRRRARRRRRDHARRSLSATAFVRPDIRARVVRHRARASAHALGDATPCRPDARASSPADPGHGRDRVRVLADQARDRAGKRRERIGPRGDAQRGLLDDRHRGLHWRVQAPPRETEPRPPGGRCTGPLCGGAR